MSFKSMRITLALLALVAFIAMPALANKEMAKTAPSPMNTGQFSREVFEGFEGAFPPAGWTAVSNSGHSGETAWFQGDIESGSPYEGTYMATCLYDEALVAQDNVLSFEHTVAVGEDHLNFFISGSLTWAANYDCTVEIDGNVVYSWAENVQEDWTYQGVDIDLTDYMDQTIEIAFHYTGLDGAAIYLDAVGLNEGYEPPPPPEAPLNDTCEGAYDNGFELLPGAFSFDTDNTAANADYALDSTDSCTGYSVSGNDVVYYACLLQGEILDVSMQATFDASLFIVTDCADPQGSCVAGADNTVSEGLEEIIGFVAPADGMYYVIVSAYGSGAGPINVYGTNYGSGCVIPTEETSFDSLKSMYR